MLPFCQRWSIMLLSVMESLLVLRGSGILRSRVIRGLLPVNGSYHSDILLASKAKLTVHRDRKIISLLKLLGLELWPNVEGDG
ncbi:hypothetical protein C8J56DRAFT_190355 [Mycena floridula]|nr:hypothetical protein C8J56DRAFT_190355 [Mycena floridula]